MAYIFPACHRGAKASRAELSVCVWGRMAKNDPCLISTRKCGRDTSVAMSGDAHTVMVARRRVWCCSAAQPSVARRDDHLQSFELFRSAYGSSVEWRQNYTINLRKHVRCPDFWPVLIVLLVEVQESPEPQCDGLPAICGSFI